MVNGKMKNNLILFFMGLILISTGQALDINASRQITIVVTPTLIGIGSNGMVSNWINASESKTYNFPDSWFITRTDLVLANETEKYNLTDMKEDILDTIEEALKQNKNVSLSSEFQNNLSTTIDTRVGSSVSNNMNQMKDNIITTLSSSINERCNNEQLQNNIVTGVKAEMFVKDEEVKNITNLYNSLLVQNTAMQRDYSSLQQQYTQTLDESNKKNFFIIGMAAIILVAIFAYWSGGNLDLGGLSKLAWKKGPPTAVNTAKYPYKPTTEQAMQELRPQRADEFPDFGSDNPMQNMKR